MGRREDDDDRTEAEDEGMSTSPEIRRAEWLEKIGPGGGYAGYGVYSAYIKGELEIQDKRKASFEQRALAVITTSGTLVTLLFALAAFSTKQANTFTLPNAAKGFLAAGLALFFVSALAALRTNAPVEYQAVEPDDIRERLRDDRYTQSAQAAERDLAFTRLKELESAKMVNDAKGRLLQRAMACEALGVGCVGVAVLITIL